MYVIGSENIYGALEKLDLVEKEKYSSDDLKKIAAQVGVSHVLTGSYITIGDQFIINIALQNPYTSQAIKRMKEQGIGVSSVTNSLDSITLKVKSALDLSDDQIAADYDKKISDITTSSPEALQYYNQALQLRMRGETRKALEMGEKAIENDPDFAMAYRLLSMIYFDLNDRKKKAEADKKLFELKEHLPLREKLFIEQNLFVSSWEERYRILKRILEDFPEDMLANSHFAEMCECLEKWDECIEQLEMFIRSVKVPTWQSYGYLALAYRAKGFYNKAEEILKSYRDDVEDLRSVRKELAITYACQAKYDLALFQIEKAISLFPDKQGYFETKGNIYYLRGEFEKAEIEYRKMVASDNTRLRRYGTWRLGNLYIAQGMYGKVKKEAEKTIAKGETTDPLFFQVYSDMETGRIQEGLDKFDELWIRKGEVNYLRMPLLMWKVIYSLKANLIDEAQRAFEEYKIERGDSDWEPERRDTLYLQAEIELKKGNYSYAIDFLKEAISLLHQQHIMPAEQSGIRLLRHNHPHCMYMSLLGLAYYQKGDLDNAWNVYEKLTMLTVSRLREGDKYAKSFYMLGKIAEQRGWPGKAIEHYEKFLEVWKDADPDLPEVEDAKKRFASLRSN